jgi:hypothetical protein
MSAKYYEGHRTESGVTVTVRDTGAPGGVRTLDPRLDLFNHSPSGFEFGYGGSGPAQLALAICADVLGDDERALRVYQDFKWRVTAPIDGDDFSITEARAREVIAEIERERAAS